MAPALQTCTPLKHVEGDGKWGDQLFSFTLMKLSHYASTATPITTVDPISASGTALESALRALQEKRDRSRLV